MTIKIMLADDHHVVRQGLRVLLEAETDFEVVGEAADGLEVIPLLERLQPDVLLLDLMMPGLGGLAITQQINQRAIKTRVLILSMHTNEAYVLEALQHGAVGYVLKKSQADELVHAIREVVAGRTYLSPPFSEYAIQAYKQKTTAVAQDPYDTLTTREREVLHLAAEGLTNADIAQQLVISRRTVEMHRANLMEKLGLRTQTDLVRYALWKGILPLENPLE
jgi:DNA-binding NarL/FixJ family response regulator